MPDFNFLKKEELDYIAGNYKTPVYVYSQSKLNQYINDFKNFESPFGHTVRYAMKANSNISLLRNFLKNGIKIDASSEHEVYKALDVGFGGEDIQLSSQELAENLSDLIQKNVFFVATSLNQLEVFGQMNPGGKLGVRINPGIGSGAFKAISTGGPVSSFGIWYEYIPDIQRIAEKYDLHIKKIHLHIGSENTPEAWKNTVDIGLNYVSRFPEADALNMGGGFKMAITSKEKTVDLPAVSEAVKNKVYDFYQKTGRKIHLETEPGKYLMINSACLITKVIDIVDTGENGYTFIRTDTGMTELPRISLYGIQQPIKAAKEGDNYRDYVIVGHCCESDDILTCKLYSPGEVQEYTLPELQIGDYLVVEGVGAYNSSMSMKNYNLFPEAAEVLIKEDGEIKTIRERQDIKQMYENEVQIL